MRSYLSSFVPRPTPLSGKERLRSPIGALVGILLTGLVGEAAVGHGAALPAIVAPMGASAVLLFAVPASPLAQPWSIMGGNLVAALVGVAAARLVPDPFVAAALAVGVAIALMMTFRCIHPPSGAVALTAVLGGHGITDLGFGFVLWPVLANSAVLLGVALVFNRLVGRSYPHRPPVPDAARLGDPPANRDRLGVTSDDIDAALAAFDQLLDVDRGDLETLLRDAEIHAYRRRAGRATCASVMTRNVVAIDPAAPIRDALSLLRQHPIKALPVTDERARVIGLVTQTDLLEKSAWTARGPQLATRQRLRLTFQRGRAPHGSVEDVMTVPVPSLRPDALLADAVRLMAGTGLHHLPVTDGDGRLRGLLSQSDLVVALLAEASGPPAA